MDWDYYYLIKRHDGKRINIRRTRHEAAWDKERYHDCDDYEIIPVSPLIVFTKPPRAMVDPLRAFKWPEVEDD